MILRLFLLAFVIYPFAATSLEPLSPGVTAQFDAGVHFVIGCEGCHWEEPDRIERIRIPEVCGDCHPGAHEDFTSSAHWTDGSAHAVCTDCHGLHGMLPVKNADSKAFRSIVCGDCHPGPMAELVRGPHGPGFEQTGALVCASCHGNHAVIEPSMSVVEPVCITCHPSDSQAFALGTGVAATLEDLRLKSHDTERAILNASDDGYDVRRAETAFESGNAQYRETRRVWHSLDTERIDEHASGAAEHYDQSLALIQERIDIQSARETGIVIVWVAIGLAVLLLHLKRKSLYHDE